MAVDIERLIAEQDRSRQGWADWIKNRVYGENDPYDPSVRADPNPQLAVTATYERITNTDQRDAFIHGTVTVVHSIFNVCEDCLTRSEYDIVSEGQHDLALARTLEVLGTLESESFLRLKIARRIAKLTRRAYEVCSRLPEHASKSIIRRQALSIWSSTGGVPTIPNKIINEALKQWDTCTVALHHVTDNFGLRSTCNEFKAFVMTACESGHKQSVLVELICFGV